MTKANHALEIPLYILSIYDEKITKCEVCTGPNSAEILDCKSHSKSKQHNYCFKLLYRWYFALLNLKRNCATITWKLEKYLRHTFNNNVSIYISHCTRPHKPRIEFFNPYKAILFTIWFVWLFQAEWCLLMETNHWKAHYGTMMVLKQFWKYFRWKHSCKNK